MIGAILAKGAARNAFAAMNRHDLESFMMAWGDNPIFDFPGKSILGGRYQGRAEIQAWFERWWERFPTTTFSLRSVSVDNIFAITGTNTIHVEWMLDETDREGRSFHLMGVTSLYARDGRVVYAKDYIFDQDVIEDAWAEVETE